MNSRFDDIVGAAAASACEEWGYARASEEWVERAKRRLPTGLGEVIASAVDDGRLNLPAVDSGLRSCHRTRACTRSSVAPSVASPHPTGSTSCRPRRS